MEVMIQTNKKESKHKDNPLMKSGETRQKNINPDIKSGLVEIKNHFGSGIHFLYLNFD